jgi:hypothetical protein
MRNIRSRSDELAVSLHSLGKSIPPKLETVSLEVDDHGNELAVEIIYQTSLAYSPNTNKVNIHSLTNPKGPSVGRSQRLMIRIDFVPEHVSTTFDSSGTVVDFVGPGGSVTRNQHDV